MLRSRGICLSIVCSLNRRLWGRTAKQGVRRGGPRSRDERVSDRVSRDVRYRDGGCAAAVRRPFSCDTKIYICPYDDPLPAIDAVPERRRKGPDLRVHLADGELPMNFARWTGKLALAACLAAALAQVAAQAPTTELAVVRGVVIDSANQQPVVGAQVI